MNTEEKVASLSAEMERIKLELDKLRSEVNGVKQHQKESNVIINQEVTLTNHPGTLLRE